MEQPYVHPEQMRDEVFLTNCQRKHRDQIGWKTKRFGVQAFDTSGNLIVTSGMPEDFIPVFVKVWEVKAKLEEDLKHPASPFRDIPVDTLNKLLGHK